MFSGEVICNIVESGDRKNANENKSLTVAEMAAQCCVCHFLLVNNTYNMLPIWRRFQVIAQ